MNLKIISGPDCVNLQKYVHLLPVLILAGALQPSWIVLRQLMAPNVRSFLFYPEEAGLSPIHTWGILTALARVPSRPAGLLRSDRRELASHRAVTWWFPKNTDATFIADRIRTLTCPCGPPSEQRWVEDTRKNFGLLPGCMGFLCLRATILTALRGPPGSGQALDDIIQEAADFRGATRCSVSWSIRFSAQSLFTDPIGVSRVRNAPRRRTGTCSARAGPSPPTWSSSSCSRAFGRPAPRAAPPLRAPRQAGTPGTGSPCDTADGAALEGTAPSVHHALR